MTSRYHVGLCPIYEGAVGKQQDGTLFPHQRYADGCGYGPDQRHDLVQCEGSNGTPKPVSDR